MDDETPYKSLSFANFCKLLTKVSETSKFDAKLRLIFSESLRKQLQGSSVYPLLRLLLPHLDRKRTYNLKEKKIAKLYEQVLGLGVGGSDSNKMANFSDPNVIKSSAVGDFSRVMEEVLSCRSNVTATACCVWDVNQLLDELTKESNKKNIILQFIQQFSAMEQKWLIRIILKDMKIGLKHERLLQFLHPDAVEMFNHTNDLKKVCHELTNSQIRYVPQITPFQSFTPMLAKRVDFGECTQALNCDAFAMEPKLDGERITCHIKDGEIQFISRNGTNYTEKYGPPMYQYIRSQILPKVDCILDGEMMVWDNLEARFREFGHLKTVAMDQANGDNPHRWMCFIVWDIVYLGSENSDGKEVVKKILHQVLHQRTNNEVSGVMGLPLYARRKILERVVTPLKNRVTLIEHKVVDDKSRENRHSIVMKEVDLRISNGDEGVILKDLGSHYMCGETSRKAKKWIKLKPDYAGMTSCLDVLILGGFYGEGKRRGGDVSHFLLGVLGVSLDENSASNLINPPIFYTVGKVGTGYSLNELQELRNQLQPHWQPWDNKKIPEHFNNWIPKGDSRPDVWIDPRYSKIVEIYGFEISFTDVYAAGLTLRFPRCRSIRYDKNWYECLSLQELNLKKGSLFNKRKATDVSMGEKRKVVIKRKKVSTKEAIGINIEMSQADVSDVVKQSKLLFDQQEFCVLPGKYVAPATMNDMELLCMLDSQNQKFRSCWTKHDLERLLYGFGAKCVQNPIHSRTNFVLAASDSGLKVSNLKKNGTFDIVRIGWIADCIVANTFLPLKARDYIFACEQTRVKLSEVYDEYGDHYTDHTCTSELQQIFQDIDCQHLTNTKPSDGSVRQKKMKELYLEEQEAFITPWSFLWHCVVFVDRDYSQSIDNKDIVSDMEMDLIQQEIQVYGGQVTDLLNEYVTHFIVASEHIVKFGDQRRKMDLERKKKIEPIISYLRRKFNREPALVSKEWVLDSIKARKQLPVSPENYQILF